MTTTYGRVIFIDRNFQTFQEAQAKLLEESLTSRKPQTINGVTYNPDSIKFVSYYTVEDMSWTMAILTNLAILAAIAAFFGLICLIVSLSS